MAYQVTILESMHRDRPSLWSVDQPDRFYGECDNTIKYAQDGCKDRGLLAASCELD
jgi:hypothetical protein